MSGLKKIIVLDEFTKNDLPYGLYWCHFVTPIEDRWFLVMRNNDDVCLYNHYLETRPGKCVDYMTDIYKRDFLSCLKNNANVVYLRDFVN